jgi:hypothetical protein
VREVSNAEGRREEGRWEDERLCDRPVSRRLLIDRIDQPHATQLEPKSVT